MIEKLDISNSITSLLRGKNDRRNLSRFVNEIASFLAMTMLLISLGISSAFAQEPNDLIEKGNSLYKDGKFGEAEMTYREGQETGADSFISGFNLGDALFKQERYEEAANAFQSLPNLTDDKDQKASAFHNLGNSFLKAKKYQESVDAFKQSLRNDPRDLETKYNLSYAKRMLQQEQEQQQQQQQQDQDKDDKKDEEKKDDKEQKQDQQKQDEKKDGDEEKKDQQQQQDQKQDEQKEEQQQQQPEENKISKEDAERMLDALNQDEKEIRDRLEKQKVKQGVKGKIEKDW